MARRRLNRGFFELLGRKIRYFYLRLIFLPGTPDRVARGLAAGVFVGLTPTVPFQTMIAVPLALLLRGNLVAAAIGVWITNPLTIPFFYTVFFLIGRVLTPYGHGIQLPIRGSFDHILELGLDLGLAALFGGMIMSIVLVPLTYFFTFKYVKQLQEWERAKIRRKLDLSPEIVNRTGPGRP